MIRRINSGGGHSYFDVDEQGTERRLELTEPLRQTFKNRAAAIRADEGES
jgi:hypothetical protein